MDFGELGVFILVTLVAVSILAISVGFTVRVFLGPVMRDIAERVGTRARGDDGLLVARLDQLDDRLAALEGGIDRIEAAQEFDRRLGAGGPRKTESA